VTFDGSTSNDTAGISSWKLKFGDGTQTGGSGQPPAGIAHSYFDPGTFTATLSITGSDGGTGTATQVVKVTGAPSSTSTWLTNSPIVACAPAPISFDGSLSTPGNWTISWGDGTADATGTGTPPANVQHTYQSGANYTATLTVVANDGTQSHAEARSTLVTPSTPIATTQNAASVTATSAGLRGHVIPTCSATTRWFKWGTSRTSLTNKTPVVNVPVEARATATLTNLSAATTYYYRLDAQSPQGTTRGTISQLTTLSAAIVPTTPTSRLARR
jgi:PKD repeat protein